MKKYDQVTVFVVFIVGVCAGALLIAAVNLLSSASNRDACYRKAKGLGLSSRYADGTCFVNPYGDLRWVPIENISVDYKPCLRMPNGKCWDG